MNVQLDECRLYKEKREVRTISQKSEKDFTKMRKIHNSLKLKASHIQEHPLNKRMKQRQAGV